MTDPEVSPTPHARTEQPSKRRGFFRRHRALTILLGLLVTLIVVMLVWLWYLNRQLGGIPTFDADRKPIPAGEVRNILLVGVDDPAARGDLFEMLESGEWEPGAFRSDAIMVLHINGDRGSAQMVSIPRDSYVPVEGMGTTKINASFSLGGPKLLTTTVEDLTGVRIDHVAIVDFGGFIGTSEAIGGVDVVVPETVTDPRNGRTLEPGPLHLEGENALEYVRARYGLPRGDFDRVQRQQNFLRATSKKLIKPSMLANPVRLTRLINSLDDLVAVDDTLTPSTIRNLAFQSRNLRPTMMRFVTVPYTGTPTIDGASVVTLDIATVREMFDAIDRDQFESWYADKSGVIDELPPVGGVQ